MVINSLSITGRNQFQLQKKKTADGPGYAAADRITVINGAHSSITHIMIKSAGKIILLFKFHTLYEF